MAVSRVGARDRKPPPGGEKESQDMVEIKTDAALDAMREAGRVVARALAAVQEAAAVGVSLRELDEAARAVLSEVGARSPFLGYRPSFAPTPFPAVICTSVNDAVVHGIPTGYRLRDGDLVSIDCGAELDGWTGDAAVTFTVGRARPADRELIDATRRALDAGIAAAVPGNRIGDISHAIGAVALAARCGMPADFGGHGIGRRMHEDPHLPNRGRPGRGFPLRHGVALAIEPMLMAGGRDAYRTGPDGWTLSTVDGSRAAHIEHTVAVTHDGPRILTLP
jgi:methionyl aminopeptidase